MRLRAWLDKEGHGATARLARDCATRWATIDAIANGHVPKAKLALKIEEHTRCEVTAAEVLGLTSTGPAPASAEVNGAVR